MVFKHAWRGGSWCLEYVWQGVVVFNTFGRGFWHLNTFGRGVMA